MIYQKSEKLFPFGSHKALSLNCKKTCLKNINLFYFKVKLSLEFALSDDSSTALNLSIKDIN